MNQYEFYKWWREEHPKLLDVSSEVPFYYGVYQRIADILQGGAMVIDKSVKADKARMMTDTAAVCYTHFVEDLAGARTFEIISRHIPDCKDPILWIISMIRPVTELTEEGRKLLEDEITRSATQVESHLLLEWMIEKLNSTVFLDVKEVALWMLHNHYLMRTYAEAPMYDTLGLMTEFFDFTVESQQAAQSYVAFLWKFRMGGDAFTVIDLLKEWGSEEERVYPFRSIYEMVSIAPTLYEPISNLKSFAVLRNQEGELLDVYWDECDPIDRKDVVMLSMVTKFFSGYHFNGPSVCFPKDRFGRWHNEVMWQQFTDLEYKPDLYPKLRVKRPPMPIDYDRIPDNPSEDYEKAIRDVFAYYVDSTPEDIDGCLTALEGWVTRAEAMLPDSDKHNLVFFLTFSILRLFPIYHETTFLSGYTKFNSRIRSLYERLESALVAAYPQCYDVHLSSEVTKLFIAQLIDLNKHPFFKKDKVYNLNHLIKELRKR